MGSIFDLVKETSSESSKTELPIDQVQPEVKKPTSIFQMQPESDVQPEKKVGNIISGAGAFLKGAIKETREQFQKTPIIGKALKEAQGSPLVMKNEEFNQKLEGLYPTNEGFVENALERGGRKAPYAITMPGNILVNGIRSIASGFLGETAKEAGGNDTVQAVAEIFAYGVPGFGSKITPKGDEQKKLVDFARSMGLTEKQIAPALQGEGWLNSALTKIAPRRGGIQTSLENTSKAVGGIYNSIKDSPEAAMKLQPNQITDLVNKMKPILIDMPYKERQKIVHDFVDLVKDKFTGKGLINFYQDINSNHGSGSNPLSRLLKPLQEAVESISPKLGENFSMTNALFKNNARLAAKLKPSVYTDLYGALGDVGKILIGLSTQNPIILGEYLGEKVARNVARQMLTNPRFQNLSQQMIDALNSSKFTLAKEISEKMLAEANKEDQGE